jgi:hypothetical protein
VILATICQPASYRPPAHERTHRIRAKLHAYRSFRFRSLYRESGRRSGTAAIEKRRFHFLNDVTALITASSLKCDDTFVGFARLLFVHHSLLQPDGVTVQHGLEHPPVVDLKKSEERSIIDATGVLKTAHERVNQRPVRNGFAELGRLAVFKIRMHLVEVAAETGEIDNIGGCDRARGAYQRLADLEVFEIFAARFFSVVMFIILLMRS